jgi:hypothetical protein
MANRMLPLNDTDFWWLRYGLGIALPIPVALFGIYSMISQHSYVYWRGSGFVPVHGTQAVVMGAVYLGIAIMFFANCYLQYNEKWAYSYQWPLGLGALMTAVGTIWCSWIFIAG